MVDTRIVVRLDLGDTFQNELWERYTALRRGRRQDFVMGLLRAGLAVVDGRAPAAPTPAPASKTPRAAASTAPATPKNDSSASDEADGRAAGTTRSRPAGGADSIVGFFGETPNGQPQ